jgi:hypothetical protein
MYYLQELCSDHDFECYDALIKANTLPDEEPEIDGNWYNKEKYKELTREGVIRGWWLKSQFHPNAGYAGWCAMRLDAYYPLDPPGSYFLLGGIIHESYRKMGLANYLWQHRINLYGHKQLTVCIRPGNLPTEHLAEKYGFEKIGYSDPYNWYLRNPK